jgi:hypothetical protein
MGDEQILAQHKFKAAKMGKMGKTAKQIRCVKMVKVEMERKTQSISALDIGASLKCDEQEEPCDARVSSTVP